MDNHSEIYPLSMFQNLSCLGAMFDVSGRTTHEQGTHISFRSIIYSYNCPIRWIYCKEIVFDLANDSVRSLYQNLYRDRVSDLYSYILSDRMDIWYRDQKWMLSRIVLSGYLGRKASQINSTPNHMPVAWLSNEDKILSGRCMNQIKI